MTTLAERAFQAALDGGREKMGDLARLMARSCIYHSAEVRTGNFHHEWMETPRDVQELMRDMRTIAQRMRGQLRTDLSSLPLANPSPEAALEAATACLRVEEAIEGTTPRLSHLRAVCLATEGRLEEADEVFIRALAASPPRRWFLAMQEYRQSVLLRLGRYEEAARLGEDVLEHFPESLCSIFNAATGMAWLGRPDAVDRYADWFSQRARKALDPGFWQRMIAQESEWFAQRLGREPADILSRFAVRR